MYDTHVMTVSSVFVCGLFRNSFELMLQVLKI